MKNLLKILALVAALAFVITACIGETTIPASQPVGTPGAGVSARPEIGYQAPDFTLSTLGGEEITLSSLQGQPVFINFWSYT